VIRAAFTRQAWEWESQHSSETFKSHSHFHATLWHLGGVPSRPLITIGSIAAFVAGMVLASSLISAFSSFPKVGSLWRKYEHLQKSGKEYSLIYIGSSRVYHEFIPQEFDAALGARGHHVKSLNFGQDAMWPPESFYMLRQILKAKPKGLRWVFIEVMPVNPVPPGFEFSQRFIYWHDWKHTWIALRNMMADNVKGQRTIEEKAGHAWIHLGLWWQRFSHAGKGCERLQIALNLDREKKAAPLMDAGFEKGNMGPLRGEELETFKNHIARLRTVQPSPILPAFRDALADVAADVRAVGAEPIFVVSSNTRGRERFTDWPPAGVTMFAFDDPDKFPALYDPNHRCDVAHLDPLAAQEFTRLLAERFTKHLERKPQ